MIDPAELMYWRRRAIAVASILGLVLVVVWAVSGPSQPAPVQTGGETNTAGSTELSFAPPAPPAPAGEPVAAPSRQPAPSQASLPGAGLPTGLAAGSDLPGGGLPPAAPGAAQPGAAQPGVGAQDGGLPAAGLPTGSTQPGAGLPAAQAAPGAPAAPGGTALAAGNPGLTSSGLPAGTAPGAAGTAPGTGGLAGSTPAGTTPSGSVLSTSSALPPAGSTRAEQPDSDQLPSGTLRPSHSGRPGTQVRPGASGGDFTQGQSRLGAAPAAAGPTVVPPGPLDDPNSAPPGDSGSSSGSGGAAGLPGAAAGSGNAVPGHAGRPGAAAVPVVAKCGDQDLALVSQVAAGSYKVGQKPLFRLVIANIGDKPCSRDLDPGLQGLVVNGPSGQLWASNDCDTNHKADVRVLDPGKPLVFSLNWAGRTSHPGCGGTRTSVGPGTYQLIGKLGSLSSGPAPFTLTSGEPGPAGQAHRVEPGAPGVPGQAHRTEPGAPTQARRASEPSVPGQAR